MTRSREVRRWLRTRWGRRIRNVVLVLLAGSAINAALGLNSRLEIAFPALVTGCLAVWYVVDREPRTGRLGWPPPYREPLISASRTDNRAVALASRIALAREDPSRTDQVLTDLHTELVAGIRHRLAHRHGRARATTAPWPELLDDDLVQFVTRGPRPELLDPQRLTAILDRIEQL